jgi:hypothetical protein
MSNSRSEIAVFVTSAALFPFRPDAAVARLEGSRARLAFAAGVPLLASLPVAAAEACAVAADGELARAGMVALLVPIATMLVLAVFTAIAMGSARVLGGKASFASAAAALVGGSIPGLFLGGLLGLQESLGWYASVDVPETWLRVGSGLWSFVAQVAALAEVYGFSTGRATASVLVTQLLIVGGVIAAVVVAAA